ncbi:hypothetical protein Bca4012_014552 [Brassica carinata]|uniref:RPW8 domain-containing protein n=1 Tax=Brassica carinata TaxID=52824 RepID=A0A8X7Q5L6_BRACI|nr:hypothetical protein Bca52824_070562 [Brassica carinata]
MPMGELMTGTILTLILPIILDAINETRNIRSDLDRLDETLSTIIQANKHLHEDSQRKIMEDLKHLHKKVRYHQEAYAKLRCIHLLEKYRYTRIITELKASLRWITDTDLKFDQWAANQELKAKMSEMNTTLARIENICMV